MKAIVTILLIVPLVSSCSSPEIIYENFLANLHDSEGIHLEGRGCSQPLRRSNVDSFGPWWSIDAVTIVGIDDTFDGERLSTSTRVNEVYYAGETRDWASLRTWETWTVFVPVSDGLVLEMRRWASPLCSVSDWDEEQNGVRDGGARQSEVAGEAASGDSDGEAGPS